MGPMGSVGDAIAMGNPASTRIATTSDVNRGNVGSVKRILMHIHLKFASLFVLFFCARFGGE